MLADMKSVFEYVHHVFCIQVYAELANFTQYSYILCNILDYDYFYLDYNYDYSPQILLDYRLH